MPVREGFFPVLPVPVPLIVTPSEALPAARDEGLFASALARLRQSSQDLHALLGAAPTVRDTFIRLLEQRLDLGEPGIGLRFAATEHRAERFVPIADALAYVTHDPVLDPALQQQCTLVGLSRTHALFACSVLQVLERLKSLDPAKALTERWDAYWDARAPATPLSRREQANRLYLDHLQATAEAAFACRALSAEALKPLLELLDTGSSDSPGNAAAASVELLAMHLSDGRRVELPGACVITVGDRAAHALLYLPMQPLTIKAFASRRELEQWLLGQSVVPAGSPADGVRFEYTVSAQPVAQSMTLHLARQLHLRTTALRTGVAGQQPGGLEHGVSTLAYTDVLDGQLGMNGFFMASAAPEHAETAALDLNTEVPALFGSLYADIPWPQRLAAVNRQRDALETLMGRDGDEATRQSFKDSFKALETAEQDAETSANALLNRARALDLSTINREFTALYRAHRAGLLAEIRLQRALEQLDQDEYTQLKALLEQHDTDSHGWVAASLTLSLTQQDGERITVQRETLNGPFVMAHERTLSDDDSGHGVWLYWPGCGGGLQRFASRKALERDLFKMHGKRSDLSVRLQPISGDPLQYALDALTVDFEAQAGALAQRPVELAALRKRCLAGLQVPVHAARRLAFQHILEQDRSVALATDLPGWLTKMRKDDRVRFKQQIHAYIQAMHTSHELLATLLVPRDDFTRLHLHTRLRKDFAIKGAFEVQVDLPDSVSWQREAVPAPGYLGQRHVLVASAEQSRMSLEALAQLNIDNTPSMQLEPFALRLRFMKLTITTADPAERQRLTDGITLTYLKKILPELDLPGAYEQLIFSTFMGKADEPLFVKTHRRECLIEPWRLMLKLQGERARLQQHIRDDDLLILNIAIDAANPQAWQAGGKRVAMLPASLTVGGQDTPAQGSVTLSGVMFIQEQISATTLLYLPDSPDGQYLRRFDSLEAARKGLFNLCLSEKMVSYLANRALNGTVRAHESRIGQAVRRHFDAMIGVGERWPATTSLAAHQLNAHMGRLIEAHRGSSRSNHALHEERYALAGPRAFNYMKMALGLVPFVGTVLALYDAWTAANQAVAAFLRGKVGDGILELESVLLSLVDAAMDLMPGEVATSVLSRLTRSATRTRQLHTLLRHASALDRASARTARQRAARFAGYEYQKPLSLAGIEPGRHGVHRNVYRHPDGDFIVRQGRVYEIERSNDSRNWRLRGTGTATYKQPIALDESGQWDTWFGVYGTTFEGGGLGGGAVLGHLVDALDPIWPQAIRHRLPRWFTDDAFRRQHRLTAAADELAETLDVKLNHSQRVINRYIESPPANRASQMAEVDAVCIGDLQMTGRRYQMLAELLPLTHGNKRRELIGMQSHSAMVMTDRLQHRVYVCNHRLIAFTEQIDQLLERLDDLAADAFNDQLAILAQIRTTRVGLLGELDRLETLMKDFNHWYERITVKAEREPLSAQAGELNERLSEGYLLYLKTAHRLETVQRHGNGHDVAWFYFRRQQNEALARVERAFNNQYSLAGANVTREQRSRILQDCLESYAQFRRELDGWVLNYPQHLHLDDVPLLVEHIEKMTERARKGIDHPGVTRPTGSHPQTVFETEDGYWLIGVEKWESTLQKRQYTLTGPGGRVEIWEQGSNGQSRLLNPLEHNPVPARYTLAELLTESRSRLNDQPSFERKIQGYVRQDMSPVNLEHMMLTEAGELSNRARLIADKDPRNPIIQQLHDKAADLQTRARQLRTRQTLITKKLTEGMLEDLHRQNVVQLRKSAPIKNLGKRPDGQTDFMQEYEVWDVSSVPSVLLWYAHFHYNRARPSFRQFEKAHLKLPEHRYLTRADNSDLPHADISHRSPMLDFFDQL